MVHEAPIQSTGTTCEQSADAHEWFDSARQVCEAQISVNAADDARSQVEGPLR